MNAIFVEPQYLKTAATTIANETKVNTYELDPVVSGAFENSNGRTILENNFNGVTKYITGEIDNVRIENNFGKSVVYFDNAIISKKRRKQPL